MILVLVTGASGFLGRTMCRLWESGLLGRASEDAGGLSGGGEGPKAEALAGTFYKNRPDFERTALLPCDLSLEDAVAGVLDEQAPEVIIHTAALTEVDRWEEEPEMLWRVNVEASRAMAAWAADHGSRFVFTSTDLVFDGSSGPYREEDPPRPLSRYGQSKAEAEEAVLDACPDALVVRMAIMYGWGSPWKPSSSDRFMSALRAGQRVTLYSDEVRSFLYVGDGARALWDLGVGGRASGILNLGGKDAMDRYRFGLAFASRFGLDETLIQAGSSKNHPGAPRPGDVSLVSERAEALLGRPVLGVAEGLEAMACEKELLG